MDTKLATREPRSFHTQSGLRGQQKCRGIISRSSSWDLGVAYTPMDPINVQLASVLSSSSISASNNRNNRGGEQAAMSGASARATRGSGIDPEIDLWGLKDLPRTSRAKKTPVRKGYTVKVDRKGRDKDMRELRRTVKANNLAVSSLPVYMVPGAPRIPDQEAAARDGERKDATAASVGCGASVQSTLQFGSMPVINICPSLLTEAEADHDLDSLRREQRCSTCPEQFSYGQEAGRGSAPATAATARTREGVVAAVAVATEMRVPPFSEDRAAARRAALDNSNSGSGSGGGGYGAGSDGRKDSPVPVGTGGGARAMSTMAAGGREDFRSDSKGDEHLVVGGANSSRAWYAKPYYRVSHDELTSYYHVNLRELASSRKRLLDTDGDDSELDGLVAAAGRRGGIVLHGRGESGFGMETDPRYSTEGRAKCSHVNKRMKAGFCGEGAQGNGGSNNGGDGTESDDNGAGGGGGIPIVSCSDSISGDSISGNISGGSGSGVGSGGGSSGGGDACAKSPSRDSSIGDKRKRRDDDDGNEVVGGDQDYDVKTAAGYDGDYEDCVVGARAVRGQDGVFRRTRGSRGQIKRSRSMTAHP